MSNKLSRMTPSNRSRSAHFFQRENDRTVRLRIRFSDEEATLIEEAAGSTRLVDWITSTVIARAHNEVERIRHDRPTAPPPS